MSVCRSRAHALLGPCLLLCVLGCSTSGQELKSPTYRDDFGDKLETQPITAESVSEGQMLHRRAQVELKGGASIPVGLVQSNNFEPGPMIGIKGEIEAVKNLFLGISFDWAHSEESRGVSTLVGDPRSLAGVEPDQLFEDYDRYTFLALFDYDLTLEKNFIARKTPLIFRFGAGAGVVAIDSTEDTFLKNQFRAAGSEIKIEPFYSFILRPAVSFRWQVWEHGLIFVEGSFDWVSSNTIKVKIDRESSRVGGDIDFSSLNVGGGFAFEF